MISEENPQERHESTGQIGMLPNTMPGQSSLENGYQLEESKQQNLRFTEVEEAKINFVNRISLHH